MNTQIEPKTHATSSVYYAIACAPLEARPRLNALYALNRKWREAASASDAQFAVTTLNWWHHELEAAQTKTPSHPALLDLQTLLYEPAFADALQQLLHGHMHWHHLNRVESLSQLQPTVDAIGGQFVRAWMLICAAAVPDALMLSAGRAVWWIDQLRHLGHHLRNERIWIPMQWMADTDVPAHILLNTNRTPHERARDLHKLLQKITAQAEYELEQYEQQYALLDSAARKKIRSWHIMMQLRGDLLAELHREPDEIFKGLVTLTPLRKWWRVVRTR